MPDSTLDRQRERDQQHTETKTLSADHVNRMLTAAVKDATTTRHPAERRQLDQMLDRVMQAAGPDKQAVESFAAVQRQQLEDKQRLELDTAQRLQASPSADVDRELEHLRSATSAMDQRMSEDRARMRAALVSPTQDADRRAVIDEALRQQDEVLREQQGAVQTADRVRLDRDISNVLRARVDQELGDRRLSDEALQRTADEARSKTRLADRPAETRAAAERAAVNRVKGQLFEELLELKIRALLTGLNKDRPADRQLEFIAGHRIRDENNQKLTDGVLAWRDQATRQLTIEFAFEAKAGPEAAQELSMRVGDLTAAVRQEALGQARDQALDDVLGKQRADETAEAYAWRQARQRSQLTDEQRTAIGEATDRHFAQLTSRRGRTELGGQIQATIERLAEQDVRIDGGLPESLGVDRRRTAVLGVLPNDVRVKDNKALRVDVSAAELQRASEALVDEQKRRGLL
jgi:hypothetical protein